MTTTVKQATATTKKGTVINITCTSIRGFEMRNEVSFCDGDNVEISKGYETKKDSVVLMFADKKINGYITTNRPSTSPPLFFGYFIGDDKKTVLPFEQDVYEMIDNCKKTAIGESENDESYAAHQTKKSIVIKADAEYCNHQKAVANMMSK